MGTLPDIFPADVVTLKSGGIAMTGGPATKTMYIRVQVVLTWRKAISGDAETPAATTQRDDAALDRP